LINNLKIFNEYYLFLKRNKYYINIPNYDPQWYLKPKDTIGNVFGYGHVINNSNRAFYSLPNKNFLAYIHLLLQQIYYRDKLLELNILYSDINKRLLLKNPNWYLTIFFKQKLKAHLLLFRKVNKVLFKKKKNSLWHSTKI